MKTQRKRRDSDLIESDACHANYDTTANKRVFAFGVDQVKRPLCFILWNIAAGNSSVALAFEQETAVTFALRNHWTYVENGRACFHDVAQGFECCQCGAERHPRELADHRLYFYENNKPVAIAMQPYGHSLFLDEIKEVEKEYGLVMLVPPAAFASFHYPGNCRFILFTRPNQRVRWLAEQTRRNGLFENHISQSIYHYGVVGGGSP